MDDIPEEGYDLDEMSEDEKDEAILTLGAAYNQAQAVGANLHNALVVLSRRLMQYDTLGVRGKIMRDTAFRMQLIARMVLPSLVSEEGFEQMAADAKFEDIISNLDMDKE